jgi:hypothetical protein
VYDFFSNLVSGLKAAALICIVFLFYGVLYPQTERNFSAETSFIPFSKQKLKIKRYLFF